MMINGGGFWDDVFVAAVSAAIVTGCTIVGGAVGTLIAPGAGTAVGLSTGAKIGMAAGGLVSGAIANHLNNKM